MKHKKNNKQQITQGPRLKKSLGQHFLREQQVVDTMLSLARFDEKTSVFEIGCGDGFLTRSILQKEYASMVRLWIFEIDSHWASFVGERYKDARLTICNEDFLAADLKRLEPYKPWTLLANLPYNITFPILYRLVEHVHLLREGVIMVQEEVAQKIVATEGRGYGVTSLYFQHIFEWKLSIKIAPEAFFPPPAVFSRLLYFKPRVELDVIPDEKGFWKFAKACFAQPRRMLRNNLAYAGYDIKQIPESFLSLRAQQMSKADLILMWTLIRKL